MKILFFSHYFPPEVNAPAARTHDHGRQWVRDGEEMTVITGRPNCPKGVIFDGYKNRLRPDREELDGIRVVRVWTIIAPTKGIYRRTLNYLSYLFSATWAGLFEPRPDVIVATSPQFFCAWAGLLVGMIRRIPVVVEVRDIWPASIEAVGAIRNRPALGLLVLLEKAMYRWARHIITVGDGYRQHIIERYPAGRDKVSIITNGVNLGKIQPRDPDPQFLAENGLEGKFVCSYIGTIGMAHGLSVVLRAAQLLKQKGRTDVAFLLVGDGAQRTDLEQRARMMGVDSMVHFLGLRPTGEVLKILASSDVLLVHLRGCELFQTVIPSKIFETMAMQRPIIMGVTGEALDIVMRAHAGLPMRPDSEQDLVQAVETLIDRPELAAELSAAGRRFVAEHYNRETLADEYVGILRAIVEGRTPCPTRQDLEASEGRREEGSAALAVDQVNSGTTHGS